MNAATSTKDTQRRTELRTALDGVRVFDGESMSAPRTVILRDGLITGDTDMTGARVVDGYGATLLPGLIDAHVHLHDRASLDKLAAHGVTTAFDMACWPVSLVDSLRERSGTADVRSAGLPAIGPGGHHAKLPGMPDAAVVLDPAQARAFVAARIGEGSDYIKVVLEGAGQGGPDQATVDALVVAAHAAEKKVFAHAVVAEAYEMALSAGVDAITHLPVGAPLPPDLIARLAEGRTIVIPTLTMMEGILQAFGAPPQAFAGMLPGIAALCEAGVPVLAGTDANTEPGVPFNAEHGASLHHELELLVAAGLTCAEALRSATSEPARHLCLPDRGAIRQGLRADLLLVDGDPLADIRATSKVVKVWCAGIEVEAAS